MISYTIPGEILANTFPAKIGCYQSVNIIPSYLYSTGISINITITNGYKVIVYVCIFVIGRKYCCYCEQSIFFHFTFFS